MLTYTHLPYAITEMFCIVFAVIIWMHINSNIGSEHEVRQLRNMVFSYLAMLATDILWALTEDGLIQPPHLLNAFMNAVTISAVSCGCYYWFRFIEDRLHFPFASSKLLNRLFAIPLIAIIALDATSIFTGWIFYIDAGGHYQSTSLFIIHTVINYFYLLIPTVYSIYKARKARFRQDRTEYLTYAVYMIAPMISGLLEDVFPHVPLLALNIFLMILILFLMIQNMQIYHDALTGLNNRRRLNQYLDECISKASAECPVFLFILDINSFKQINDVYGHIEGDQALKATADMLTSVATRYYAFVARYGGDEFCLVTDDAEHTPEEIAADIDRSVRRDAGDSLNGGSPYALTVSIGYSVCGDPDSNPDHIIAQADKLLYENKRKWHVTGIV